jgi:NADH:ubiquinone reductase (H+-translocating)
VLIDRRNHHIFQPLLYQTATALLAPAEVAAPIRQVASGQANLSVMLGEVVGIDAQQRSVEVHTIRGDDEHIAFDYLVLAPGMQVSYFGHEEFALYAPSLKTMADAESICARILSAYEEAELCDDENERARLLTFVLVGAGPTGVELAASLAGLARSTLRSNFRRIDPATSRIVLIEAGPRILPSFQEALAAKAARRLARIGVEVLIGTKVEQVDASGVLASGKPIASRTVLWTAGVAPAPVLKQLGAQSDRAGRVVVGATLEVPDRPGIFVLGDAAALTQNGRQLPGVAQVAIQQGRYVGRLIADQIVGRTHRKPFRYFDKGNMAVIGRNFALLDSHWLRWSGYLAWVIWGTVHLMALPQMQNRLRVGRQWIWWQLNNQRSSRIIPEQTESAVRTGAAAAASARAFVKELKTEHS